MRRGSTNRPRGLPRLNPDHERVGPLGAGKAREFRGDDEMPGGAHRKKFRKALDDAEYDGLKDITQSTLERSFVGCVV